MPDDDDAVYRLLSDVPTTDPILLIALDGWVDAGLGASAAMATVVETSDVEPVAIFDGDLFIDQRARRPIVRIVNGVNRGLTWPEITVAAGRDRNGRDLLVLTGPEPDFHWRTFVSGVVEFCLTHDVHTVIGLGAFPAPAPHTRPVKLAATAPEESEELVERVGVVGGELEVPAGVTSALELAMGDAGIPMVTLWARVPHYVAAMAFPDASVSLLDGVSRVSGLRFDDLDLRQAADASRRQVDDLISSNPDHVAMVRTLEASVDETEGNPFGLEDLPSGDELAAELEQFLRGESGE